jgi:hypothetical protein
MMTEKRDEEFFQVKAMKPIAKPIKKPPGSILEIDLPQTQSMYSSHPKNSEHITSAASPERAAVNRIGGEIRSRSHVAQY